MSVTRGRKFSRIRGAINSNKALKNGKHKGWMASVAQCWYYMDTQKELPEDLRQQTFVCRQDVLVIPLDREPDLQAALTVLHHSNSVDVLLSPFVLRYPTNNMAVLHFEHEQLTNVFHQLLGNISPDSEPSATA